MQEGYARELYMQYKGLLFKLAYQLTGSVSDAEDVVQDVFLKIYDVPSERLAEPKAYLCKMVANRCRDLNKSARKKREEYFGEWLPEPLLSSDEDLSEAVARDDLLSYAMLVLLERLSPTERVVFVLREALGFEYREIAGLIDKSEVNCRKLFSRASAKLGRDDDKSVPAEAADPEWAHSFMDALKQGSMSRMLALLDPDAVLVADGGGKATAAVKPIKTGDLVARFLLATLARFVSDEGHSSLEVRRLNGQYGILFRSGEGVHTVGMLHVEGGVIRNLYIVRNPDKLAHVGD